VSRLLLHVPPHGRILFGSTLRGPDHIVRVVGIHSTLESGTGVDHGARERVGELVVRIRGVVILRGHGVKAIPITRGGNRRNRRNSGNRRNHRLKKRSSGVRDHPRKSDHVERRRDRETTIGRVNDWPSKHSVHDIGVERLHVEWVVLVVPEQRDGTVLLLSRLVVRVLVKGIHGVVQERRLGHLLPGFLHGLFHRLLGRGHDCHLYYQKYKKNDHICL